MVASWSPKSGHPCGHRPYLVDREPLADRPPIAALADLRVLGARLKLMKGGDQVELTCSRPEWSEEAARLTAASGQR